MREVVSNIDVLDEEASHDLNRNFHVLDVEDLGNVLCVSVKGCPLRIHAWLTLNEYDVDPDLYPELFSMKVFTCSYPHDQTFVCLASSVQDCYDKMRNFGYFSDWSDEEFSDHWQHVQVDSFDPEGDLL